MDSKQQTVLTASEKIKGYSKEMMVQFGLLNLSLIGLMATAAVTGVLSLPKYEDATPLIRFSSEAMMLGCFVYSALRLKDMVGIAKKSNQEQKNIPKEGSTTGIIGPLQKPLEPDERKLLAVEEERLLQQKLLTGNLPITNIEAEPLNNSTAIATQRLMALGFIKGKLLNKKEKSSDRFGPEHRIAILEQIKQLIPVWAKPYGLDLTLIEAESLLEMVEVGAITELAPATKAAYAILVGDLLQAYISNLRADSRAVSMRDSLLETAIRSGTSIPITEWKKMMELKEKEKGKVIIGDDDAIRLAKSLIALSHTAIPEAKEAAIAATMQLSELLDSERGRRYGPKKDILGDISTILGISMRTAIGDTELSKIQVLFDGFSSLPEGLHFFVPKENYKTPLSLLRRFAKTDFGSILFENNTVYISAINMAVADTIAAAVAILFPHIPFLNIQIDDGQTLSLAMDAFYLNRLMRFDKGYLRRMMVNDLPPQAMLKMLPKTD